MRVVNSRTFGLLIGYSVSGGAAHVYMTYHESGRIVFYFAFILLMVLASLVFQSIGKADALDDVRKISERHLHDDKS